MRHSFATGQFILLYLIIVLIYKFFDCHEICTNPELWIYEKLIFRSDAYTYSHHYDYSETILSNQPPPIVSGKFEILDDINDIDAPFPFTFYGSQVTNFRIFTTGRIEVYDQEYLGEIKDYVRSGYNTVSEVLKEWELLAVRTSYYLDGDGDEIPAFTITTLIHPNGKISIYYEDIPEVAGEIEQTSGIYGWFDCGEEDVKEIETETYVLEKWIKSGTLVVYEAVGDCPKCNSFEECHGLKTSDTKCIWCETASMCITSNDEDTHKFKVNGCKVK